MKLIAYRMEKQVALVLAAILIMVAVWPLFSGADLAWPWLAAALLLLLLALLHVLVLLGLEQG